ncbi:MAG: histidine kinase [Marinilabiliales bacterium]|nr:histidine kinase [Marinilabiliales bacterium]
MEQRNPSNRFPLLANWVIPIILAILQTSYDRFIEILPWGISTVDGMVFGFLLGAFGLAIWFVVRYNSPDEKSFVMLFASHFAAATTLSFAWFYSASFVAKSIQSAPEYPLFLDKNTTSRIMLGFFFYFLLAAFFYLYIYYKSNREKLKREKVLQTQLREAVLRALKSQINPHFLFNSLNSIASLTMTNPEKAHEMVIALSDFMRYSLRKQHNELVTLEEEISHVRLYLQIEKIRFGNKMAFSFETDPECLACKIPTLLLQPLFENAVKYGVYEASETVEIRLRSFRQDDHVLLTVSNTYDPEAVPAKGEGIGLKNVKERLRLVYNSNNLMEIHDKEGRFEVRIFLPCPKTEN